MNFFYAAYQYLDECIATDSPCIEALKQASGTFTSDSERSAAFENAREALMHFATAYSVSRTLPASSFSDEKRLQTALSTICKCEAPTQATLEARIDEVMRVLAGNTERKPLSAATKFLWARFQHPVVIYDSLAWKWVKREARLKDSVSYTEYAAAWRIAFARCSAECGDAAKQLCDIQKFTAAITWKPDDLRDLVSREWFIERVFDHSIMNDALARKL